MCAASSDLTKKVQRYRALRKRRDAILEEMKALQNDIVDELEGLGVEPKEPYMVGKTKVSYSCSSRRSLNAEALSSVISDLEPYYTVTDFIRLSIR